MEITRSGQKRAMEKAVGIDAEFRRLRQEIALLNLQKAQLVRLKERRAARDVRQG